MMEFFNRKKLRDQALILRKNVPVSIKKPYVKTTHFLKQRPMGSFFIALSLLFVILLLGQLVQKRTIEKFQENPAKSVKAYSVGESPQAIFQAKIEKSGVVKIMAQAPGIVQNIGVKEGDSVSKGQQILSLSSNYQGGNAPSVQRQIAQTQYQNILDTFDQQKDLIQKQRDVANTSSENAQRLRDITRTAAEEADHLVHANQEQLDQMKAQ